MAKSDKKPVPTINPPNSGMRAWLNQTDPVASDPPAEGIVPKEETNRLQGEDSKSAIPTETQAVTTTESVGDAPLERVSQPEETDVDIRGNKVISSEEVVANNAVVPAPRKPKSRVGEGAKAGLYPETFFKKPVIADGDNSVSEPKPVRISEESHWLLSVLVSEARRQGHKLNVGDLIDNLLANHRSVYKSEVNELINQWKARKKIG